MTANPKVPANLADALAELMQRLPQVSKDQAANIKPGFAYQYADLADISSKLLPVLGELGLSFTSRPTLIIRDDGTRDFVLAYRLLHVSGGMDEGEYLLPDPNTVTPQTLGGRITYARRYCLCAVTGLQPAGEDDDAQEASKPQRTPSDQELRGADRMAHEALRREGRPTVTDLKSGKLQHHVTGTDPDDEWYSIDGNGDRRPAAADLPHTYPPGQRQLASVHMYFDRLGKDDTPFEDEERLGITGRLAGTGPIESTKELTQEQVKTVLKELARHPTARSLREAVADMKEREDAGA